LAGSYPRQDVYLPAHLHDIGASGDWDIFLLAADEHGLIEDDFSPWIPIRNPPCSAVADFHF
jgi:hypothetical protein